MKNSRFWFVCVEILAKLISNILLLEGLQNGLEISWESTWKMMEKLKFKEGKCSFLSSIIFDELQALIYSFAGSAYKEMVHNIISPIVSRGAEHCTLARFDIHHALPSNTNALIGRAAHIAVLDSELFIEKFLVISILKYFQWNCWHWINTHKLYVP